MKFGVVVFPGSNCDKDVIHVCKNVMNCEVRELWHKDDNLQDIDENDCIILPGGFSYGDYLRSGAIARFSPIMEKVVEFANNGGLLIGICNGFQILCEAGLLPGALLKNEEQLFKCCNVHIKVESNETQFTNGIKVGSVLKIPIAHSEGRYYANEQTIASLKANNQIIFSYCKEDGSEDNPNGSLENIAGICNVNRNIIGLMPHPERAAEADLGNKDGFQLFNAILKSKKASQLNVA